VLAKPIVIVTVPEDALQMVNVTTVSCWPQLTQTTTQIQFAQFATQLVRLVEDLKVMTVGLVWTTSSCLMAHASLVMIHVQLAMAPLIMIVLPVISMICWSTEAVPFLVMLVMDTSMLTIRPACLVTRPAWPVTVETQLIVILVKSQPSWPRMASVWFLAPLTMDIIMIAMVFANLATAPARPVRTQLTKVVLIVTLATSSNLENVSLTIVSPMTTNSMNLTSMNVTVIVSAMVPDDVTQMVNVKTVTLLSRSTLISTVLMFALHATTHATHAEDQMTMIVTLVLLELTSTVSSITVAHAHLVIPAVKTALDLQAENVSPVTTLMF
jgi:hypothetical protein